MPGVLSGVERISLSPHRDERGTFTEVFRKSWDTDVIPAQWNVVSSRANVLRGVHAHRRHADYLLLISGRATVGVHDLRDDSPTNGQGVAIELTAERPEALVIPTGVAHGFYFHDPSIHVYAVSHEWDPADELGCSWNDPGLGIDWPCLDPLLSERDEMLGPLKELRNAIRAALVAA